MGCRHASLPRCRSLGGRRSGRRRLDLAFLAIDPARADRIAFSAPYVEIEGTYLVRENSSAQHVTDLDRDGLRIAVGVARPMTCS